MGRITETHVAVAAVTVVTVNVGREQSDRPIYDCLALNSVERIRHATLKSAQCRYRREVNVNVVPVQPQTFTVAPFYAKPSSRRVVKLRYRRYPVYVTDH